MGFTFDDSGFKKLQAQFEKVAEGYEGPLSKLLTDEFMRKHTIYGCFDDFADAAGIRTQEEFEATPEEVLDEHVSKNTKFDSWANMTAFALIAYKAPGLVE